MATTTGVAVVWGIPAARQAGTGFETVGSKFASEGKIKEMQDEAGETKTVVTWDLIQTLELDVYPTGATPGSLPTFGTTVTVNSITYMYIGGEETSTNEGEQKMTFRLKRWPSNVTIS